VAWPRAAAMASTASSLLAYALLFPALYRVMGPSAAAFGCLPVLLAGGLLGTRWGVGTALTEIPIHALLFALVHNPSVPFAAHVGAGLGFALIGGVVGRLRDLGTQLGRSHSELARALSSAREAQAALAEREALLALAHQVAATGYWVLDLPTQALTWSPELCRILGEDPATAQPTGESWWAHVHPDDRARIGDGAGPPRPAEPGGRDYRILRNDGTVRWVHERGRVLAGPGGRAEKHLGTVHDLTEQHALQEQLAEAERLAAVGTLAAGVAHEVNNPLSSTVANVRFLEGELQRLRASLAADQVGDLLDAAAEARQGAERVGQIVRDLLAFARAERERVSVDVEELLELSLKLLPAELRGRARLVQDHPGVPRVRGDVASLGQVFVQLLANAAQAIPPGRPDEHEIHLTTRHDGDQVAISIRDTGCGMPPEVRRRAFEPVFTTRPPGQGRGLGLATSRSTVRALGGDIEVESAPGRGSTFTVRLPVAG
jgi:PAS domain S-box-containing protein